MATLRPLYRHETCTSACSATRSLVKVRLKALAAHDNGVPFYAAMPLSTFDAALLDGVAQIPIEERHARELTHITGRDALGATVEVQLAPDGTAVANPAFDVTPARLVTGLITERGIVAANADALRRLQETRP
jgi:methylthioribose-1-phosphate isomerase